MKEKESCTNPRDREYISAEIERLKSKYRRSLAEVNSYMNGLAVSVIDRMFDDGLSHKEIENKLSKLDFRDYLTKSRKVEFDQFISAPTLRKKLNNVLYSRYRQLKEKGD